MWATHLFYIFESDNRFLFLLTFCKLPTPIWEAKEEELVKWYEERDLPVPIGGNFNFVRKSRRVARW